MEGWEGLRSRRQDRTDAEGIMQHSVNHRDITYCHLILCSGFVTPSPNIDHSRESWRRAIYIDIYIGFNDVP